MFLIDDKTERPNFLDRLTLNKVGMYPFFMSRSAQRLLDKRNKKIKMFFPKINIAF